VVIENCFSSVAKVISGVPQDSVLGPILFIIFINDIDSVCHGQTNIKLFADDAKLYSAIDLKDHSLSLQISLKLHGSCQLMFVNVVFCLL
jgi:ribonuclease P/MRP protein subunit RPP40